MDLGIAGKLAVVTGGSRNVGRAVAEALAADGCRVIIVSRGIEDGSEAAAAIRASGHDAAAVCGDVGRHENIPPLFAQIREEFGNPDILVYSNGGPPDSLAGQASVEEYRNGYELAVVSFLKAVEEVVPHMKQSGWGRIVTLGSMCARHPHKEVPMIVHNIVRPAALGAARTLANELGPHGITVNTIGTGRIDSGETGSFRRTYRTVATRRGVPPETLMSQMLAGIPVARAGRPEEAGALCTFLCSDRAGFITGQLIMLDGGQNNNLY